MIWAEQRFVYFLSDAMKEKKILFIDDGPIDSVTGLLKANLRKKGYSANIEKIDLAKKKFRTITEGGEEELLDLNKIKKELKDNHFDISYDVVACDFNFAGDKITGFDVLKWLIHTSQSETRRIRKAIFIFYSSEEDKFLEYALKHKQIIKLINLKIDSFQNRPQLPHIIPKKIAAIESKLDFPKIIRDEMEAYPEQILLDGIYPPLKGKKLTEIATKIEKEDFHGVRFVKHMVERTTACIIKLNED